MLAQGIPFDEDDSMLNPSPVPQTNQYPAQLQVYPQSTIRQQVISATEDMRRLFEECEIGKGNAQLLNQALTFSRPEELGGPVISVRIHYLLIDAFNRYVPVGMVSQVSQFPRFHHGSDTVGNGPSGPIA
jgi:hypothetical protein